MPRARLASSVASFRPEAERTACRHQAKLTTTSFTSQTLTVTSVLDVGCLRRSDVAFTWECRMKQWASLPAARKLSATRGSRLTHLTSSRPANLPRLDRVVEAPSSLQGALARTSLHMQNR
jgi:hypothetical protein